jgi:hypothetical protein
VRLCGTSTSPITSAGHQERYVISLDDREWSSGEWTLPQWPVLLTLMTDSHWERFIKLHVSLLIAVIGHWERSILIAITDHQEGEWPWVVSDEWEVSYEQEVLWGRLWSEARIQILSAIEIQQIFCISGWLKLAGALQIVSQIKMRYWACQTPTFGFASISRNKILYLASILGFAGAREIFARYSLRPERPLIFLTKYG